MKSETKEKLEEYALLSRDEGGEAVYHILQLDGYRYCFSDEFLEALDEEAERQIENFEEYYDIVEREEVVPERKVKVKELVPKQ